MEHPSPTAKIASTLEDNGTEGHERQQDAEEALSDDANDRQKQNNGSSAAHESVDADENDNDDDDDDDATTSTTAVMGGLTRGLLYSLKNTLGLNATTMLQAMLRKQSFLHLGKRTMTNTTATSTTTSTTTSALPHVSASSPSPPLIITTCTPLVQDAASQAQDTQNNKNSTTTSNSGTSSSTSSSRRIRWITKSLGKIEREKRTKLKERFAFFIVSTNTFASSLILLIYFVEIVKGTILGVAVFGIYDYLVHQDQHWSSELQDCSSSSNDDDDVVVDCEKQQQCSSLSSSKNQARTSSSSSSSGSRDPHAAAATVPPLWVHVGAGAMAGLVQSIILDAWEIALYVVRHYYHHHHHHGSFCSWKTTTWSESLFACSKNSSSSHSKTNAVVGGMIRINTQLVYRRVVHHSLGYATLFGCYEGIRRTLVQHHGDHNNNKDDDSNSSHVPTADASGSSSNHGSNHNSCATPSTTTTMELAQAARPVVASFVAGGLAGQAHYCMSYYTRHWKWHHHHHHSSSHLHSSHHLHHPARQHPQVVSFPVAVVTGKIPIPQWPAIRAAFLPTAVTFVAFQHGEHVLANLMANDHDD
jgi:hypothetical protein